MDVKICLKPKIKPNKFLKFYLNFYYKVQNMNEIHVNRMNGWIDCATDNKI